MRFSPLVVALAGLTGLASAYDSLIVQNYNNDDNLILKYATEIPVCANLCIFQAAVAVGCETSNYHCQCSLKRLQLFSLTENCLAKSCNRDQIRRAHSLTDYICNAVADGVPNPNFNPPPLPPPPSPAFPPAPAAADEAAANFPPALTDAPIMRRDLPAAGAAAPAPLERRASFVASSIPSSAIPTATEAPTAVATAGASMQKASAVLAGVGAAAAAALLL